MLSSMISCVTRMRRVSQRMLQTLKIEMCLNIKFWSKSHIKGQWVKNQMHTWNFSGSYNLLNSCSQLQWRHNERGGISNHQPHDCLLNRLFRRRSKKISKLHVTGLYEGNHSPVTGEFPAQRASNTENVSIWWCHHVFDEKNDAVFCDSPVMLFSAISLTLDALK